MVHRGNKQPPTPPIPFMPPQPPYATYIAGSGIIEASSENVSIGVTTGQVVEVVYVQAGTMCKKGDPLFQQDTRVFQSQVDQAQAEILTAKAQLSKLVKEPRPEEVPPLEFAMYEQQALWNKAKVHLGLYQNVTNPDAISQNEYNNAIYDEAATYNSLNQAKANLALKLAGAWIEDIHIASQVLNEKEKQLQVALAQLDQTLIRAPFDGQVLQVKIYPGAFAQSVFDTSLNGPMLLYGRVDPMHIRVNIDEEDAWRFKAGSPATAYVRGNSKISIKLEYVRTEPYIIPKQSLTGDNSEQTDTRVLQVIYKFKKEDLPVYIGQLMDIFLEAPPYP